MAKILIVDDSAFMRKIIKDILTKGGYTDIEEAESYKTGMALYKSSHPELVLLDLVLPDKNGMEILREIRKKDQVTKAVIISSVGQSAEEARKLGVNDYFIKPFDEKKVLAAVKKLIG